MAKQRNYYEKKKLTVDFFFQFFFVTFCLRLDLHILFELVNRIKGANEPIQRDLEQFAYDIGMEAIDDISAVANEVNFFGYFDRFDLLFN